MTAKQAALATDATPDLGDADAAEDYAAGYRAGHAAAAAALLGGADDARRVLNEVAAFGTRATDSLRAAGQSLTALAAEKGALQDAITALAHRATSPIG